jgi:PAS domain S-box-containing protein
MSKALRFCTWISPTNLVKASPGVKIVAFISVFGVYWLAFPWMLRLWGMPSRVFAVSYIVLAALLWGLKGGLLVAMVNIPVVISLLKVLGIENIAPVIAPIITLSLAAIVGRLTDLSLALEAQYVRSSQAEQALQAHQQHLEHVVQERTSALAAANQLLQQEIAERQRTEVALRSSEERYRQLVENINDVIYATDARGVFTYLSPAVEAHSGYTPAEIIGHGFADYVYQEDRQRILQQFEKLLAGHGEPSEYRIVTKAARSAGSALPVDASTKATRWLACKERTATSREKGGLRSNFGRRIRWKRLGPSLEGLRMILIIFLVLYWGTPNWLSSIGRMDNQHAVPWNKYIRRA